MLCRCFVLMHPIMLPLLLAVCFFYCYLMLFTSCLPLLHTCMVLQCYLLLICHYCVLTCSKLLSLQSRRLRVAQLNPKLIEALGKKKIMDWLIGLHAPSTKISLSFATIVYLHAPSTVFKPSVQKQHFVFDVQLGKNQKEKFMYNMKQSFRYC